MTSSLPPLIVAYDDLVRNYELLGNHDTTPEFLEFVINQEECRKKWNQSETECQRLQLEIQKKDSEGNRLEKKIQEIRKHLEGKMESLNKLELEKERIVMKNNSAKALLKSYLKEAKLSREYKDRLMNILHVLETGDRAGGSSKSPALGLDTISEDGGTTDLSMTQSEDDLDLSVGRGRRRSKRASAHLDELQVKRTRQNTTKYVETEQVIAKTILNIPKDGPMSAIATVEGYPSARVISPRPSAPPLVTSESESDVGGWVNSKGKTIALMENNRAANQAATSSTQSPRFGRTLSSGGQMALRQHAFCQKTVIKPETCEPCGKRIKFSKMALKCRDCRATCHPECKDKVPIPCVSTGTPSNKNHMGTIADYVPAQHPMVPSLIQHCINEIEVRGLDVIGLYRVPGPEREVKELKEKFLRGKGVPNLARYDIHAICGCVKDFLRSLQEPLVGRWFWRDFALAAEISDPIKRQQEIERIIQDLPPPNQDTLAFVLLHLQRIAESVEVKMPIGNLAKVFGPTIVGYSENDLTAADMLKETKKQQLVLETLLNMPGEFWRKYAYRPDDGKVYASGGTFTRAKAKTVQSPYTPQAPTSLSIERVRSNGKKIYFNDDSPKEGIKTRGRRGNFFDG